MTDKPKAALKATHELTHPIQPIGLDHRGVPCFKKNRVIERLLDLNGRIDLNTIGMWHDLPREDHEQLLMLLGYTIDSAYDARWFSDETLEAIKTMQSDGVDQLHARYKAQAESLERVRTHARALACELFAIHPDSLQATPDKTS